MADLNIVTEKILKNYVSLAGLVKVLNLKVAGFAPGFWFGLKINKNT
jgi:hypothetical protein